MKALKINLENLAGLYVPERHVLICARWSGKAVDAVIELEPG